jgi:gluconokinase
MIADVFNKPVGCKRDGDTVATGAFLVAATESGIYKNLDDTVKSVMLPDIYKPKKQNHELYKKHYPIFEKLSVRLFGEFEAIAALQEAE